MVSVSLQQRGQTRWDYLTLWALAKRLLTAGHKQIQVVKLEHCHDGNGTVIPTEGENAPTFMVWPEVYKRMRQQHGIPIGCERQPRPKRKQNRTGGICCRLPSAVLNGLGPPAPGAPQAAVPPLAPPAHGPPPLCAPADFVVYESDDDGVSELTCIHVYKYICL